MNKTIQGYHVLIIDDEPHVLEGLKTMVDWDQLQCSRLYFCESSEEAARILDHHKIDLMITDIRLPGKSGLEFIESIKNKFKKMKIVVMSGYRDFDNVKRAMTLGVDGYLVKPVFQEDAYDVINPIIKDLNTHTRIQTYSEESALFTIKDYLTNEWDQENLNVPLQDYIEDKGCFLLTCWNKEKDYSHNLLHEILYKDGSNPLGIILYEHDFGLIALVKSEFKTLWMDVNLNHETLWQTTQPGLLLQDMATWFKSFRQALPRVCHRMQGHKVLDLKIVNQENFVEEVKLRKLFLQMIREGERDLFDRHTDNLFFLLTKDGSDLDFIRKQFMEFYYRLIGELEFSLKDRENEGIGMLPKNLNDGCLETLLVFFERQLVEIMEISKKQRSKCKENVICQVEELMRQHMAEPITLTEMAKEVHLHPVYLGQKLSEYWGESFKRRLNRLRVEAALELLLDDDYGNGIEACAYEVGFKNYMTFLKYFKLFYHTTPRKYLEKYRT